MHGEKMMARRDHLLPTEQEEHTKKKAGWAGRSSAVAIKARHRQVFEEVQRNGGRLAPALIAAGYAASTAGVPKAVTSTKSWKALMEEYLPEDKVALRHSELLDKRERRAVYDLKGRIMGYIDEPETAGVSRALEMAYKLRGSFVPEAPSPGRVVCGAAAYTAYQSHLSNRVALVWVFAITAVLFNPIVPFYLDRGTWQILDAAAAALFFAFPFMKNKHA